MDLYPMIPFLFFLAGAGLYAIVYTLRKQRSSAMEAFTKGDYALETTNGTACVHVPHDISADSLAHAAARLVAAKAEADKPKAA